MAFKVLSKQPITADGIPYLWNSGDTSTLPDSENETVSSDLATYDLFGYSVCIGSSRIVVGAVGDDDNGSASGSVYAFDLNGVQLHKITASDGVLSDNFGTSLAIGSGVIAVGAPYHGSDGAVYLYDFSGAELLKIVPGDGTSGDLFGWSLSVSKNLIFIGAPNHSSNVGAVYIYTTSGSLVKKITHASTFEFGTSIEANNDKLIVGTSGGSSVYVYSYLGVLLKTISSFDYASNDAYGSSVSIGSGRILVGAPQDDDNSLLSSGSAYLYDYDGRLLKKLTSSAPEQSAFFGVSTSIGSGRLIVGSYGDDSEKGSVYIYDLDGNFLQRIQGSTSSAGNQFGRFLNIGNGRIAVSGPLKSTNSGSVFIYNTPLVYNLYDYLEMENY